MLQNAPMYSWKRGVQFEEYDMPAMKTVNSIFTVIQPDY